MQDTNQLFLHLITILYMVYYLKTVHYHCLNAAASRILDAGTKSGYFKLVSVMHGVLCILRWLDFPDKTL